MALPTRPVYLDLFYSDGTPQKGYVEFTMTTDVIVEGVGIVQVNTIRKEIDATGRVTADLLVTDSPTVSPVGLLWYIEEKTENGNLWYVEVPTEDGSPLNLSTMFVPGLTPPGYPVAGPQGPRGEKGDPGINGLPGAGVAPDGFVNNVLVKKSSANYDTQWVSGPLYAVKVNAESRTTTILQDDIDLKFTVEASTKYELEGFLIYASSTIADLKLQFVVPDMSVLDWGKVGLSTTATAVNNIGDLSPHSNYGQVVLGGAGVATPAVAFIRGILRVNTVPGTFKLQWALNTADAITAYMYNPSYLKLSRIP